MFRSSQGPTLAEIQGQEATNPPIPALNNVGGWLILLLFNLSLNAFQNLMEAFTATDVFSRVLCFICASLSATTVFLLVKRDKRGVTLGKVTLAFNAMVFGLAWYGSGGKGPDIEEFVRGLFGSLIWFVYLFVSKRVKAVYYTETNK